MPPVTDKTITYTLNLNPLGGTGQSRDLQRKEVNTTLLEMKNLILENVAFYVAKGQERALTSNLNRVFSTIVDKELARMGRQISQFAVGIAANADKGKTASTRGMSVGPPGQLTISGAASNAMRGQLGPVSLVSGTGPWPARNPDYVKYQRKFGGGGKWFKVTGSLQKYLREPATYTNAYGPVRVSYKKKPGSLPGGNILGVSSITNGRGGRTTQNIQLGKVEVSVLGRITSNMLNDPGQRQPSPWSTGLFDYLDPKQSRKLMNNEDFYRPFLEHFLSFYLTKSIPNAVFRKIEEVVKSSLQKTNGTAFNLDI